MANLYVEIEEVSKAIVLYNQCISLSTPETEKNNYNIKIYSLYNLGLIYYSTDHYILAIKNLEIALENNKNKNNDIDNEISAVIYETLGEVELEYRKYGDALNYLSKALDIRKKLKNLDDKFALKRISFFINFIYDQYNYEEVNFNNSNNAIFNYDRFKNRPSSLSQNILGNTLKKTNSKTKKNTNFNGFSPLNNFDDPSLLLNNNNSYVGNITQTNRNYSSKNLEKERGSKNKEFNKHDNDNKNTISDEEDNFDYNFTNFIKSNMQNLTETYKNLSLKVKVKEEIEPDSYINNAPTHNKLRDDEIKEVEKFFLFMTKLSQKEIEILNQDQINSEVNLPIYFSDNFKSCLSYSQKIQILEMKILKLRRSLILKNPLGKIEIENLNFEILQRNNNSAKKIDNILNRYNNNHNLEKWVESNIGTNNLNYNNIYGDYKDETLKKNTLKSKNIINDGNYIMQSSEKMNSNPNIECINLEYGLNNKQIIIFHELKNTLKLHLKKNQYKNNFMISDDEIATLIKNAEDEEEIKFYIKNPEIIFNTVDNNYKSNHTDCDS